MSEFVDDNFTKQRKDSFGEQKYVTSQLLQSMAESDLYLYTQCEKLEYLTPPAIRKRFNPIPVDGTLSYGYANGESNNIVFSNGGRNSTLIDLSDPNMVDVELSTVAVNPSIDSDGNVVKSAETPKIMETTIDRSTRDSSPFLNDGSLTCNEHWYISYNKNVQYRVQPNWLSEDVTGLAKDGTAYGIYNTEIPAVGRAQTFKPKVSGLLKGVTVNLKATHDKNNTASPLLVQVRPTTKKDGIAYPKNYQYDMLAEQRVRFSNSTPNIVTITFDNPPYVEAGKSYALCFLSPLTHPYNAWWLGGWSKSCGADAYPDGDAFLTENNGATWIRYGKGDNVAYHLGRNAPQDFAFECQIQETTEHYEANTEHYLYLKPFMANNIKQVEINANDNGTNNGISIVYEISPNGRKWYTLTSNQVKNTNAWDMCFVRARIKTTDENNPARINNIRVSITSDPAKQMFVRSAFYYPRTDNMLGANIWGRIGAPFECDPTVTCEAEIISCNEAIEHFTLINVGDVVDYSWLDEVDEAKVKNKTDLQIAKYLTDNPTVIEALKGLGVYVLPFEHNDEYTYFFNQLELVNSPSYPILSCIHQPNSSLTTTYGEWKDFIVNYGEETLEREVFNLDDEDNPYTVAIGKDCLYIYNDVLDNMDAGTFTIKYNPSYVKNMNSDEAKDFILDYRADEFEITPVVMENRTLQLRCSPCDPIRKVVTDEGLELLEDVDFVVDYDKATLEFLVNNTDGESTSVSVGDKVTVVYTPNIKDTALAVGYYAVRSNTDKDCRIKPNYMEYKV